MPRKWRRRRNLQPFQRAELALKLEPLIAKKAKEKQRAAGGAVPKKSAEAPIETREEVAKAAGLSHDTIAKAKKIMERAPEEVKESLRRGEKKEKKTARVEFRAWLIAYREDRRLAGRG